jgi:fructose-bisphosphate aldolase, class II
MTVANLKDVLQPAIAGRYAVAGVVVLGWEDARAYVEAAEEADMPIILQAGPGCRKHTPVSILGKMFRHLAEQAKVPVVCHMDHALTLDECVAGINHGFTSVMIDGSMLPLLENIALTSRVVDIARRHAVSVEGEVGVVGYADGAASQATSALEAARFERETGVDALVISIGNVHLQTKKMAAINFAALQQIENVTTVPLVLHGGSGIASAVKQKLSHDHRVKKFNVGTELRMAFGKGLREVLQEHPSEFDRIKILSAIVPAMKQAASDVIVELANPTQLKSPENR